MVYPLSAWLFFTAHTTPASFRLGMAIVLLGELVRIWANGYVGHMKVNQTNQGQAKIGHLITGGPYAFIRHPLYFGTLLIGLGMLVIAGNPWLALLTPAVFFMIYRHKMREEERTLRNEWPGEFDAYQRAVPRWWPTWRRYAGYGQWSWKGILASKEIKTFAWVGVALILLFFREELFQERESLLGDHAVEHLWLIGLLIALVVCDGIMELWRSRSLAKQRFGAPVVTIAVCGLVASLQGCAMLQFRRSAQPLPHFMQVDEGLARGGQPSPDGVRQLATMGVKTIVNLRWPSRQTDQERRLAEQLGMRWIGIPVRAWWCPSKAQIRRFVAIATDPAQRPVFVHCRFGRNRTGVMVAMYRTVQHQWTPRQALAEACSLGLSPWNPLARGRILDGFPAERLSPSTQEPLQATLP